MTSSIPNADRLLRSTVPGTAGYIRRRLSRARARDRQLISQRAAHLAFIAELELELVEARAREAEALVADISSMPEGTRDRVGELLAPGTGEAS